MVRRAPSSGERERDPERTKARILDAGAGEFVSKGFAGARVSRIAERAGVNRQLISYYFGGKEGLYTAALRQIRAADAISVNEAVHPSVLQLMERIPDTMGGEAWTARERDLLLESLGHLLELFHPVSSASSCPELGCSGQSRK